MHMVRDVFFFYTPLLRDLKGRNGKCIARTGKALYYDTGIFCCDSTTLPGPQRDVPIVFKVQIEAMKQRVPRQSVDDALKFLL
jgi:hypothetical protein